MREILFRGKRIDDGEWVKGYLVPITVNCYDKGWEIIEDGIEYDEFDYYNPLFISERVDPKSVGQYTGLTDKNGKKIFEGDIIDTPDRLIKVVWLAGNAQFDLNFIRYEHDIIITNFKGINMRDLQEYEVIGNVYDNPELLKR